MTNWKTFAMTFGAVFLAEFADKTQLATLAFSAESRKPVLVFCAASLALVLVTAIGASVGGVLGKWVPAVWVRRGAGAIFVVLGVLLLVTTGEKKP